MKTINQFIISLALIICVSCREAPNYREAKVSIIPAPVSSATAEGAFTLTSDTKIVCSNSELDRVVEIFNSRVNFSFGESLDIDNSTPLFGNVILFEIIDGDRLGEEGYNLTISPNEIKISAESKAGVYYGVESLFQLLPPQEVLHKGLTLPTEIPLVKITDRPKYSWRAFMLDEARNFKGKKEVYKLLDQMAALKMNIFHWHLTDDQGWRVEIKKYPKLTTVGSIRSNTQLGGWKSDIYDNTTHSGFYTQDDIKEIIAYASDRNITIVPEIGVPGHSSAAIASYPWIGSIGDQIEVPGRFGKHKDIYNVADPKVIEFLHSVLDEVMELFPSKYIHIGGDEVLFDAWIENPSIKEYMDKMGYNSPTDLQVAFTNNLGRYIESKGRKMMGWNEIVGKALHADQGNNVKSAKERLTKSAVVHFWKGSIELMNSAIADGHDVVNSAHYNTYLDYSYSSISLKRAYEFTPIPEGLDPKLHSKVLGSGAQMWGEWIPTVKDMNLQVFPRIAAFAEAGWNSSENKDYDHFSTTLELIERRWELLNIDYTPIR